jgi:hypothetical protein
MFRAPVVVPGVDSILFIASPTSDFSGSVYQVRLRTNGVLRIYDGTRAADTVTALSADTNYHVWVKIITGSGTDGFASVAFSTDAIEPTTGNQYKSFANGVITSNPTRVQLYAPSNTTYYYDEVIVDDTPITP